MTQQVMTCKPQNKQLNIINPFENVYNLLFLGHNFQTTSVRTPIKGSTNTDFRLVFLRNKKIPFGGGAQGKVTLAKKA